MEIKRVVNLIIMDFYYNGMDGYGDPRIVLERDNFRLMHHLRKSVTVESFSQYIELVNSFHKTIDLNSTEININKEVIHIQNPIAPNLNKLEILIAALPEGNFQKVFGFSVEHMRKIIECLILRSIINLNLLIDNRNDVIDDYQTLLGKHSNSFWFTIEDIVNICPTIPKDNIKAFFKLVSIDITKNDLDKDTQFLIYNVNEEYVLPYYAEFCNVLFSFIEKNIILNLTELETTRAEYSKLRGMHFEEMVYEMLASLIHNVHKNVQYVDLSKKKRELDVLVQKDDLFINFECKSSAFNIFDWETDDLIKLKYRNAFGRTFESIKALNDMQKSEKKIQIYDGKIGRSNCIFEQSLKNYDLINVQVSLSPIEFIGTNLQYFDENLSNYEVQPIVLSYVDFFIICYCYYQQPHLVLQYYRDRQHYLNRRKKIRLDIDEIDVFGMLTDEKNSKIKEYMEMGDGEIDMTFMIDNGIYRKTFTKALNNNTIGLMIENQPHQFKNMYYRLLEV
ncbi:hypothetical protein [Bacillus rubiinfantis]|uniref:hypothetical protein n=1 Tax=Bacillus rubiinfantis TaxID=1499680 RepID=UPI0005A5FF21|nr:hypothetical protein [Bacillus rubiinfantis]